MRPVCGARDCLTKRTSYVLCMILQPLIVGNKTHCQSTDDLIEEFEKVNSNEEVGDNWVVGSLDVDSLYPSLDVERCARVVRQRLEQSNLTFERLQWKEVAMYLRYHMPPNEWEGCGFREFIPTRRFHKRPPLFVSSGSVNDIKIRHHPWKFSTREPDGSMLKKMFCYAIQIMIVRTMSLHDFQLDGRIYRQSSGGSIGLDLTGVVSDIYMCEWDQELLRLIGENSMVARMYKRYKDDVNLIVETGVQEVSRNERDEKTMSTIKALAESIDPCLKVTTDVTSRYEDGRLPVLDVKVWIGKGVSGEMKILHSHYIKDVSTRATIDFRSCHNDSMKASVMVNEILRILRNCSKDLPWSETAGHVSYFMRRMQFSGYPEEFRHQVLGKALGKYDRMMGRLENTRRENGTQDRRDQEMRKREKRGKKYKWYASDGKYDSVIFVEATPKAEFKKKVQSVVKRHGVKMKVVERVGTTVKGLLQRSNPFGTMGCGRQKCCICSGDGNEDCRSRGCVYEFVCMECQRMYRGQTGRSIYERGKEQIESWENEDDECPLKRHSTLYHEGQRFQVKVRVLAQCYGKPSRRMITEAVMIGEVPDDMTMNGKNEWSFIKLAKVQVQ
jgi:hypothetical protein